MRLLILCLCFIVLRANGCRKDSDAADQPTTAIGRQLVGTWKYSGETIVPSYDVNNDGVPDSDIYAIQRPCEKDNIVRFFADGSIEDDEGTLKCDPRDLQTTRFRTWQAEPGLANVFSVYDGFGATLHYTIEQADAHTLKYYSHFIGFDNRLHFEHETYTR